MGYVKRAESERIPKKGENGKLQERIVIVGLKYITMDKEI